MNMVTQKLLSTHEGKKVLSKKKIRLFTALDLIKKGVRQHFFLECWASLWSQVPYNEQGGGGRVILPMPPSVTQA